jgi:hypothetical protein
MDPFPFPLGSSQSLGSPATSQVFGPHAAGDEASSRREPLDLHSPFPAVASHEAIAESLGRDTGNVVQARPHLAKLELLNLEEWDESETYDDDPPTCLHYSIEWKVTLNNKLISKDTEPDLVLAPRFYWSLFLRDKLDRLLQRKLSPSKRVTCDDTTVVVSVTDRSQRDLTKRFEEIDIDWLVVERQLLSWGELFRAGKRLRVDLSFNYLEVGQQPPASARRVGTRGNSATQQMLAERATQLEAEEGGTSSQSSIWQDVYSLMRCPGPPCDRGPHCWRDPVGKKHYKLRTHQLKCLIRYVEQGGQLRSHSDVPEDIREQLYAEEQQQTERQQRVTNGTVRGLPPITITNVLPGPSPSQPDQLTAVCAPPRLHVPGLWDVAVEEYSDWQQSQVRSETLQADIREVRDIALADGLDLQQIYEDQDASFFVERGVKRGVARRFVRDIEHWVKQYKRNDETGASA